MRTTGWSKSILRLKCKFSLKSKKNVFDVKKNNSWQLSKNLSTFLDETKRINSVMVYLSSDFPVCFLRQCKVSICPSDIKKGLVRNLNMSLAAILETGYTRLSA